MRCEIANFSCSKGRRLKARIVYLRVLRKKNFESSDSPAKSVYTSSGGARKGDSTTSPDAQHMPTATLQNFNV